MAMFGRELLVFGNRQVMRGSCLVRTKRLSSPLQKPALDLNELHRRGYHLDELGIGEIRLWPDAGDTPEMHVAAENHDGMGGGFDVADQLFVLAVVGQISVEG